MTKSFKEKSAEKADLNKKLKSLIGGMSMHHADNLDLTFLRKNDMKQLKKEMERVRQ